MKVLILKKTIKEGVSERTGSSYKIRNLFVKFEEEEIYKKIAKSLLAKGATEEQIERFCKPGEYNGKTTYAFGLGCSGFTFDKVEQFGILDAAILFDLNDAGFVNAKIQVIDRKEQIHGYEAPESEVDGWANDSSEPTATAKQEPTNQAKQSATELSKEEPENELPF